MRSPLSASPPRLNGGADFYAKDIDGLRKEGEISLNVFFLEMCREDGVEPRKSYSGRFNLRVSPKLHEEISVRAAAEGKSLNQWVADVIDEAIHTHS
jgi:predicted HicB family RNase H-like nuclease